MSAFLRTSVSACETCLAVFGGVKSLRELLLLCVGIAIVMGLLDGVSQVDDLGLTVSMRAAATAEAQPYGQILQIDLESDRDAAWIRRGATGIERISLVDGQLLERFPIVADKVYAASHSRFGRVHSYVTVPGGLTIVRDGVAVVEEPNAAHNGQIIGLAVTADGTRVAAAVDKCGILIWNLTESPADPIRISLDASPVHVDWSSDCDRLLVGCGNGLVTVLSAEGKVVWSMNHDEHRTTAIAWSPDGTRVAIGQYGGDIVVLNAENGGLLWRAGHDSLQVSAVSFAPDGKRLAASGFDRTVDVISAADGRRLATMPGHYDLVRAVKFLHDGDRILSGSVDGTLRIWSASAGRQLQKM